MNFNSEWQRAGENIVTENFEYPDNVVPLFSDLDNDPEDEEAPLNTALYAGPTGIFIQQESNLTDNEIDCVALTWGQTQMLLSSLISLLSQKISGDFNGSIH
jgi:hypothetical protein